jgi:phosphomannomutase
MHKPIQSIFREYDIRGIYEDTLNESDAVYIGKAFATYVITKSGNYNPTIAVARDGRLSSPALSAALIRGIKSVGAKVVDLGVLPTPALYFANHVLQIDGGVMITGSHNPPSYNGFKMVACKNALYGNEIAVLYNIYHYGGIGEEVPINQDRFRASYVKELLKACNSSSNSRIKVAWDPGNGAAGQVINELIEHLPGEHIVINSAIDGTFPNHHPDPSVPANLAQMIEVMKQNNCNLGLAFDGDADRVGVVDENGRILQGDELLMIFASDILGTNPGATIIADVKSSQHLFDKVKEAGGAPLMWKTGHSLIKAKMKETKAILAGEMSGHIFFADKYYGYDDGIYAAVRMVDLLLRTKQNLADIVKTLPESFSTNEIRIECEDSKKFEIVENIKNKLVGMDGIEVNDIDGVRVKNHYGWWLVRASNTQPALVARCEAYNKDGLEKLLSELHSILPEST